MLPNTSSGIGATMKKGINALLLGFLRGAWFANVGKWDSELDDFCPDPARLFVLHTHAHATIIQVLS